MSDTDNLVFGAFIARWVPALPTIPPPEHDLASIEERLALTLPASYKTFVSQYGTPSTASLLASIVAARQHIEEVQEFIDLDRLLDITTMYESGGMPAGYLGFAMEGSGNMFLFRRSDCVAGATDAPVHYFDHDDVEVEEIAPSFVSWLEQYIHIPVVKG